MPQYAAEILQLWTCCRLNGKVGNFPTLFVALYDEDGGDHDYLGWCSVLLDEVAMQPGFKITEQWYKLRGPHSEETDVDFLTGEERGFGEVLLSVEVVDQADHAWYCQEPVYKVCAVAPRLSLSFVKPNPFQVGLSFIYGTSYHSVDPSFIVNCSI